MRSFGIRLAGRRQRGGADRRDRASSTPTREVNGIIVQLPLPDHLDGDKLTGLVDVGKDVDGLTPMSRRAARARPPRPRPCTPSGVMLLLESAGVELEGAEAVVIGRSNLFGKPMAQLLLAANATVTICHSRTRDLARVCARADVLVAAVGAPRCSRPTWSSRARS